jgi:hypothetical protein
MSAYLIGDGTVTKLGSITFDGIREAIGGYVEPVYSADGQTILWCNEDGKPMGLPNNRVATSLWWHINPAAPRLPLVGPVVVTGGDPDNLEPVPAEVAAILDDWRNP